MSRRIPITGIKTTDLIRGHQTSFRLETFDQYGGVNEDELFGLYLAGEPLYPERFAQDDREWWMLAKEFSDRGTPLVRVRALPRQITPYIRFEMDWGYNYNVSYGENIQVLTKEENTDLSESLKEDFYLFDDKRLIYVVYKPDGTYLRKEEETDQAEILKKVRLKQELLGRTIPYKEFLSGLRQDALLEIKKKPSQPAIDHDGL